MFCTVITCMDGRIQGPLREYLRDEYGYGYPDTITDPGPIKGLSNREDRGYFERICQRIDISVGKHGSRHLWVVGHHNCAGNPVAKSVQIDQINKILPRLTQRYVDCRVTGLYVNEKWACERLD